VRDVALPAVRSPPDQLAVELMHALKKLSRSCTVALTIDKGAGRNRMNCKEGTVAAPPTADSCDPKNVFAWLLLGAFSSFDKLSDQSEPKRWLLLHSTASCMWHVACGMWNVACGAISRMK
jgi:hypothetical protein